MLGLLLHNYWISIQHASNKTEHVTIQQYSRGSGLYLKSNRLEFGEMIKFFLQI